MQKIKNFKIQNLLLCIGLAALAFSVYANSFGNQMFWDDNDFILNNQYVKSFDLKNIFTHDVIAGAGLHSNYYRPVLSTVFAYEWSFWQNNVTGWHVTNTLFHALDGILLFFILLYVFQKRWLAFLAAAIFAVHPLQTESVTYVNSLGDSLSVFWMFLGILCYLKFRYSGKPFYKSWLFFIALLSYPLALLSKETAIIMPALLFICDYFAQDTTAQIYKLKSSIKQRLPSALKYAWIFFAIALLYVLLRATVLNFGATFNLYGQENYYTTHLFARIFTFFKSIAIYFGLMFWPANQHMERTVQIATSLFSIKVLLGFAIFAALIYLSFFLSKKIPVLSFGALWFLIAISPVSNIAVPINGMIYEHWLYVPLIGIALIVIWLASKLIQRIHVNADAEKAMAVGLAAIAIIPLGFKTIIRNTDWRDPITFYTQVIKYTPDSYRVVNNLGMAYADAGNQAKAEEMYSKAISLDSSNPVAYHNLGNTLEYLGQYDSAEQYFKKALALDHDFIFSANALIKLYIEQNRLQDAQDLAKQYGYELNLTK